MARPLKIWGGTYDGVNRVIVATTTKKAAYEAMKNAIGNIGSYATWDQYTSDSGNEEEAITLVEPNVVFTKNINKRHENFRKK